MGHVWNFQKFRKGNILLELDNPHPRFLFQNLILTDGHTINFIFTRPSDPLRSLPDLDAGDFTPAELENIFQLWGLDPGVNQIFTASYGDERSSDTIRLSSISYYHMAKNTLTNVRIRVWKEQRGILTIKTAIPTGKTANIAVLDDRIRYILQHLETMLDFYDLNLASLKMQNYMGKRRAEVQMIHMLLHGNNHGKVPLIAYGDANLKMSMRGTVPSLSVRVKKLLKQAEYKGEVVVVRIDEYNTSQVSRECRENSLHNAIVVIGIDEYNVSQVCSVCGVKSLSKAVVEIDNCTEHLYSVLVCSRCRTHWNRDTNASKNMFIIARSIVTTGVRPSAYSR